MSGSEVDLIIYVKFLVKSIQGKINCLGDEIKYEFLEKKLKEQKNVIYNVNL